MSEYWWIQKMNPGYFFSCYCWCGGGEGGEASFGSPGSEEPLSIFRIFPMKFRKRYQSHSEAQGLHLFVRDAERCSDDCANSSNPTYSRSSHKYTHTHCRASATFPSLCVPSISIYNRGVEHCGALRSWLRKQLRFCQQLRVKNKKDTPCLFGQKQVYVLDKWAIFPMWHYLENKVKKS